MTLGDYKPDLRQHVNTPITNPEPIENKNETETKTEKPNKIKLTIYLNEVDWELYNEICTHNQKLTGVPDKSGIISNSIRDYHKKVFKK